MQRVIKFRAWHTPTKRWARDFKIDSSGNLLIGQGVANEYRYLAGMDYVLMQFTGLTDKNGKEIWEGDIVFWKDNSDGMGCPGSKHSIEWNDNFCGWEPICLGPDDGYDFRLCEVIGNIYENPELLK